MKILEKAASILVECGYGEFHTIAGDGMLCILVQGIHKSIDPFANTLEGRRQLEALLWYFLKHDRFLALTGDGHFDAREQIINYIKQQLCK